MSAKFEETTLGYDEVERALKRQLDQYLTVCEELRRIEEVRAAVETGLKEKAKPFAYIAWAVLISMWVITFINGISLEMFVPWILGMMLLSFIVPLVGEFAAYVYRRDETYQNETERLRKLRTTIEGRDPLATRLFKVLHG